MNSKHKFIIILLSGIILLLGFFLYQTQKKINKFSEKVEDLLKFLPVTSFELESDIKNLEELKIDSVSSEHKNYILQSLIDNGEISNTGYKLFTLSTNLRLHGNKDNEAEIDKLITDYHIQRSDIFIFFVHHGRNLNALQKADIDTLISYYKNLKAITVQVEKIKVEP